MIQWNSKNQFSVGDLNFKAIELGLGMHESSLDEFIFQKSNWMVDRYAALVDELKPKTIFELGIWRGGSCVFFHKLAEVKKLVAIDISNERIIAVDEYVELNGLGESLKTFYGIDQSDKLKLRQLVAAEFDDGIDLVIDDASHFLDETRASFDAVFPYVKPGGVYVIEDWPWAHGNIEKFPDDELGFYPQREPLTKLIFEIILACPSTHSYIDKIEIDRNSATIWRGDGDIEPEGFSISKCSLARGRNLISKG
jgi:hypothetical protein